MSQHDSDDDDDDLREPNPSVTRRAPWAPRIGALVPPSSKARAPTPVGDEDSGSDSSVIDRRGKRPPLSRRAVLSPGHSSHPSHPSHPHHAMFLRQQLQARAAQQHHWPVQSHGHQSGNHHASNGYQYHVGRKHSVGDHHHPEAEKFFERKGLQLVEACLAGNVTVVLEALQAGARINENRFKNGATPLIAAAYKHHSAVVKVLLDRGADFSNPGMKKGASDFGVTPLYAACMAQRAYGVDDARKRHEIIKMLLAMGADATQRCQKGDNPICNVALGGHLGMAELLLSHGAKVNDRCHARATPVFLAAQGGHAAMVSMLIEHGADINGMTDEGGSPLGIAAEHGYDAIVELLLQAGAEVDALLGSEGQTALYYACQNGHATTLRMIANAGADVNASFSRFGATAVSIAAQKGYTDLVVELAERGADINAPRTTDGMSPVAIAAVGGHVETVVALASLGADLYAVRATDGATVFGLARDQPDVAAVLYELMPHGPSVASYVALTEPLVPDHDRETSPIGKDPRFIEPKIAVGGLARCKLPPRAGTASSAAVAALDIQSQMGVVVVVTGDDLEDEGSCEPQGCVVCLDRAPVRNAALRKQWCPEGHSAFEPCGHGAELCGACCGMVDSCPLCRAESGVVAGAQTAGDEDGDYTVSTYTSDTE